MGIRFVVKDRSTGQEVTVRQPNNAKERESLKALIQHTSRLGMRGKALGEL